MPADPIALIAATDPAATLAPTAPARREEIRARIVASPTGRSRPRPRTAVVLAAAAALVLAAGGWAAYRSLFVTDAGGARAEFAAVTGQLALPPGARWHEPALPGDGAYGRGYGRQAALGQATCAWFAAWRDDPAGAAAAAHRIRGLMPLHRTGEPEESGGYDAATLAEFDRIVGRAEAGDLRGVDAYRRANC